ncbi:MAG: hypothetical protein AMXMBFR84_36420 [Candidatus Hydrogenedentota bacterium]
MVSKLTAEIEQKLLSVDSPTVSNAIEKFNVRSRWSGYMGPQIQCRFPKMGAVVGYATTCTIIDYDELNPPDARERVKWIESIYNMPKPCVCVVKDMTSRKGWASHWGEIMGTQIQVLGAKAIITDGAVRDLEALEKMGMKVWSEHVVVSHGWIDCGKADIPVDVGGLLVNPGDILHADVNGVVSIPHELLDKLPAAIDEVLENERVILKNFREKGFDLEAFRKQVEH